MNDKNMVLSNRYNIIERVGIGGMSYVYKAYDQKTKKIVAIKELKDELVDDEDFVSKFESEAIASKSIKHKNVVSAYDVVHDGRLYYIVLEFADGITLNKYIREKGNLTNEETIDIAIQIASGLESAHKKGIIHRDVKPQNIVISKHNIAKIMDFGIARAISSNTKNISVIGTVHYISPEQAKNDKLDYRSDIYSLGCTMYEMITGKIPFEGDTAIAIIMSHIKENIKLPSIDNNKIYKSLEKIILKATKMNPDDRYQNMSELICDLKKALKDKNGSFISDSIYNDEDTGKTLIISDDQMKLIKQLSSKFQNVNDVNNISNEEKEYLKQYLNNKDNNQNISKSKFVWMIVVTATLVISILVAVIIGYQFFNTVQYKTDISTTNPNGSTTDKDIVLKNLYNKIIGMDVDEARELARDYGIWIVTTDKRFDDNFKNNQIIEIIDNDVYDNTLINVAISKGSEVLDFTDVDELHKTKFSDMKQFLDDRYLEYSVIDSTDRYVESGYIIGVNKNKSSDPGKLIFTVSTGTSKDIVSMPNVVGLSVADAKELLNSKNLAIDEIYYNRDGSYPEGIIISQSKPKFSYVNIGETVDVVVSSGENGEIMDTPFKEKWVAELNASYIVSKNNLPGDDEDDKIIIAVRLMQATDTGIKYYELSQPAEYTVGTAISLVYLEIEGEKGIYDGQVQVVDVENDVVLKTYYVNFKQTIK